MAILFDYGPKNTRMAPPKEQREILHALRHIWQWYPMQLSQVYSHHLPFTPNLIHQFVAELEHFLRNRDGDVIVMGDVHNGSAYTAFNVWQQKNTLYQDRYVRFTLRFHSNAASKYTLLRSKQIYHFNIEPSVAL